MTIQIDRSGLSKNPLLTACTATGGACVFVRSSCKSDNCLVCPKFECKACKIPSNSQG
jgi:hypothetical protein